MKAQKVEMDKLADPNRVYDLWATEAPKKMSVHVIAKNDAKGKKMIKVARIVKPKGGVSYNPSAGD